MSKEFEERNIGSRDPDHYETGSTRPPKSQGGPVAVLLMAVILLGGLCSAMGILNIQLLRQLTELQEPQETVTLFDDGVPGNDQATIPTAESPDGCAIPELGLEGQTVSDFDRRFYGIPQGVLVLEVTAGGVAEPAGLRIGDVITGLDGTPVADLEALTQALDRSDRTVVLTIRRQQENLTLQLQLTEE